ncbi:MAG: vitamin K epoxide reductase family protein [Streptosporangiaceae bacterium]|jgi:uncharacterized membrane protein
MAKAAQRSGTQRSGAQRTGTQGTGAQRKGTGTKGAQRNGTQRNGTQRGGSQQVRPRRDAATSRQDAAPPPAPPEPAGPPAWLRWSTFALAILGLAASAYLTYTHYTDSALAGCTETSGAINCGKVTTSPQSIVFGIPVAVLGLAFYVFLVAIMSPWAWRSGRREIALTRLLSLVAGIGFVLYLLYAELFQIRAICAYCTSVHVITFLLFVLTGLAAAIWGLTPASRAL